MMTLLLKTLDFNFTYNLHISLWSLFDWQNKSNFLQKFSIPEWAEVSKMHN